MYMMKFSFKLIIIVLAFVFIIFLSMSSSTYIPYSFSASSKLPQYPYEWFSEYTTYPENKSIDSYDSKQISQSSMGNVTKLKGFDGLIVSPNSPETSLDTYSQSLGDKTCQSYGLTNSAGFLCLNPDQIKLLTTRGGNV